MAVLFLMLTLITAKLKNIFDEHIDRPDSIEDFYLRPMKYLHHELVPQEVKILAPHVE
jgi:hypothetical protein